MFFFDNAQKPGFPKKTGMESCGVFEDLGESQGFFIFQSMTWLKCDSRLLSNEQKKVSEIW